MTLKLFNFHRVISRTLSRLSNFPKLILNMDWGYSDTDTSSTNNPSSRDECLTMSPSLSSENSASDSDPLLKTDISHSVLTQKTNSKVKSRILPKSLLDSVTEKIRDGVVPQTDFINSQFNADKNTCVADIKYDSFNIISPADETESVAFCPKAAINKERVENMFIPEGEVLVSPICNNNVTQQIITNRNDPLSSINDSGDDSILTVFSDEETRTKKKSKTPSRQVPNYFISIQFSDKEIYTNFKDVQKSVMKKNGNYSLAVVPLHSLHMTLAVMNLRGDDDIERAKAVLNRCGVKLIPKYQDVLLTLPLQGLGNFNNSVVFAKVQPGEHVAKLEEIAEEVHTQFYAEKLVEKQSKFTPHVTLMKLSRVGKKLTKKTGLKKIYPDVYEDYLDIYFGCQTVESIQLCSMLKSKTISGYYHIEHEIKFGAGSSGNGLGNNSAINTDSTSNTFNVNILDETNLNSTFQVQNHTDKMTLKSDLFCSVIESQSYLDSESTYATEMVSAEVNPTDSTDIRPAREPEVVMNVSEVNSTDIRPAREPEVVMNVSEVNSTDIVLGIEPGVILEISPISVIEPTSPCQSFVDFIEEGFELAEEATEYCS